MNVARQGKATQSSTAYGGDAGRAIDGNTNGSFADGTSTHTLEGVGDPWWEVDLGSEYPIEKIVVWNRTDGNLGTRLANFTLLVKDADKRTVFQSAKNPAAKREGRNQGRGRFAGAGHSESRDVRAGDRPREGGRCVQGDREVPERRRRPCDRGASAPAHQRARLAKGRREGDPRRRHEVHPLVAGCGANRATGTRLHATRRKPRGTAPARAGEGRAQGTGRHWRARHPHRHAVRPDEFRQGAVGGPGRQAGGVRVREHRHHAAQLRDRGAGQPRKGRHRGRGVRHRAGRRGRSVRPERARPCLCF